MTAVPGAIPETLPVVEPIVAIPGLLLTQYPPGLAFAKVVDEEAHR